MSAKHLVVASLALALGLIGEAARADAPGEADFRNRCASCHSLKPGAFAIAPSLAGVIGRTAGSAKGYQYSPALRDAGFVWTPEKLTEWLASPHSAVPRTEMPFPGIKSARERADIVEFLEQRQAK
ncbi:MAG TPA: c-type cytochrome [Candidatus Margulisiibacteriota bacterium]|nr:c-type cytochrome [Candidatus Margulisiibacteriota bacterium]